jgi:hypothetical protein
MAGMVRLFAPGYPRHVMQRDNCRLKTFFPAEDYAYYLELLAEYLKIYDTDVCTCCLILKHVLFCQ